MAGIFAKPDVFTRYRTTVRVRDRLLGGTPKDPKVIEGWLRSRIPGIKEDEVIHRMMTTLYETGIDVPTDATYEDVVKASESLALKSAVGFKRDEGGLYLEGRCVKACLRECVNILYAGEKTAKDLAWAKTAKGAKNAFVERVFVDTDRIRLQRSEPDGVEPFVGHVTGAGGARSTLTYYEFVDQPELTFEVIAAKDILSMAQWAEIWNLAEEIGLGAVRSQSFGKFDVLAFDAVETAATPALAHAG